MVKVNFDNIENKGDGDFTEVPKGTYEVESEDFFVHEHGENTMHPDSEYWSYQLDIIEGNHEGRKLFLQVKIPCQECLEAEDGVADGHADKQYTPYELFNLLRATIGQHKWSEADLDKGDMDVEVEDLLGLKFRVRWGPQKNNPEYSTVKRILPLKGGSSDSDLLP